MRDTVIIGAGLSGLMMGYLLGEDCTIIEAAPEINANFQAPFFLHAPIDWLPTRWKQIDVIQNAWDGEQFYREPNIKVMNDYSMKISGGKIMTNSMIFMDGARQTGFIPSSGKAGQILVDLKAKLRCKLMMGEKVKWIDTEGRKVHLESGVHIPYRHLISTLALPILLAMIGKMIEDSFSATPIYMRTYSIKPGLASEAYQVVYVSSKDFRPNKLALMHETLFVESTEPMDEAENRTLVDYFWPAIVEGIQQDMTLKPGKFHPIESARRKALLGQLTARHGIYCLGRYATWSYKRMDHVAEDAKAIINIIQAQEVF